MRKDKIAAILEVLRYRGDRFRNEDRQALAEAAALIRDIDKSKERKWIPAKNGEVPAEQTRVEATIRHHRWIEDKHEAWVMEEEIVEHPEYIETCEAIYMGEEYGWRYQALDGLAPYEDIAFTTPEVDITKPIAEILAWRPMPEPYKGDCNE